MSLVKPGRQKQVMILKSEDLPAMVHMATSNWFVHTRDNDGFRYTILLYCRLYCRPFTIW